IVLLATTFLLIFLQSPNNFYESKKEVEVTEEIEKDNILFTNPLVGENTVKMYLPAVDSKGEGVITVLFVEAKEGKGRTLVDIDNLLFWADTQHSIRVAKKVAKEITGINLSHYDIIYNIHANASIIGGESAGAALTVATIAALQNKTLREDVMITGTVNHDGSIGPVSGILAKAKAAKKNKANLFLVPLLQSREIIYETKRHCEKIGPAEFCTIEQIPKRINISEEANITVVEVGSVREALDYFLQH
ncbi:MAG: hypothetical protein NZ889_01635, partial [Candidatus Pacearchaeota archaeon]|nr:hypothetical protein [Candidatus Pacearchaeota archaeon]